MMVIFLSATRRAENVGQVCGCKVGDKLASFYTITGSTFSGLIWLRLSNLNLITNSMPNHDWAPNQPQRTLLASPHQKLFFFG
jgi:hypothetical protein